MHREWTAGTRSAIFLPRMHFGKVRLSVNFHRNEMVNVPNLYFNGRLFDSSTLWSSYMVISQTAADRTNNAIDNTESCKWYFNYHIYTWPWTILNVSVKDINISTENFSQTVTGGVSIAVANTQKVVYGLSAAGIFTLEFRRLQRSMSRLCTFRQNVSQTPTCGKYCYRQHRK